MFGVAYDFFNLFFGWVFEEKAVSVAVQNLDACGFGVFEYLGDGVSSYGCCGFCDWWAVEVEAFGSKDSVAGV